MGTEDSWENMGEILWRTLGFSWMNGRNSRIWMDKWKIMEGHLGFSWIFMDDG
jgi:hypothetical protein